MAPRYHAESGSIIPKMRPVRSSSNLKTKHRPMKLPLVGSVMLPDTTAQRTSVVRAQFEPERLDNLFLKVFTAKPNKALYCSFRSVVMLREGHGSDQTSLTFTRVRRGNH